jgi:uncharacterized protein (TIGR02453 family)
MLTKNTLDFFTGLKANNDRDWFDAHRKQYEASKKEFEGFAQQLLLGVEKIDANVAASRLQVKDCVFRIFRDVRFSANKAPYKTNFFAAFGKDGRKSPYAGYFLCVEPGGESFIGGGIYMPEGPVLAKVRQEIAYEYEAWQSILSRPDFKAQYPAGIQTTETLSRPPQGYDASHPALAYLKMKSYYVTQKFEDAAVCAPDFGDKVLAAYTAVQPLVAFVNRAILD